MKPRMNTDSHRSTAIGRHAVATANCSGAGLRVGGAFAYQIKNQIHGRQEKVEICDVQHRNQHWPSFKKRAHDHSAECEQDRDDGYRRVVAVNAFALVPNADDGAHPIHHGDVSRQQQKNRSDDHENSAHARGTMEGSP